MDAFSLDHAPNPNSLANGVTVVDEKKWWLALLGLAVVT